jgi:hypothetical protein
MRGAGALSSIAPSVYWRGVAEVNKCDHHYDNAVILRADYDQEAVERTNAMRRGEVGASTATLQERKCGGALLVALAGQPRAHGAGQSRLRDLAGVGPRLTFREQGKHSMARRNQLPAVWPRQCDGLWGGKAGCGIVK